MYDDGRVSERSEPEAEQIDPKRYRPKPIRDILLSLGVILVPLVLLMAFCRPSADQAPTVNAEEVFRAAQTAGTFPVLVPSVPQGWRATNATLRSSGPKVLTLRVTYLSPGGKFAQLLESNQPADTLLRTELGQGRAQGSSPVGGRSWERYSGRRAGERALVLLQPQVTVLLAGDAPEEELEQLAGTLS
jgi:hypothetical protein